MSGRPLAVTARQTNHPGSEGGGTATHVKFHTCGEVGRTPCTPNPPGDEVRIVSDDEFLKFAFLLWESRINAAGKASVVALFTAVWRRINGVHSHPPLGPGGGPQDFSRDPTYLCSLNPPWLASFLAGQAPAPPPAPAPPQATTATGSTSLAAPAAPAPPSTPPTPLSPPAPGPPPATSTDDPSFPAPPPLSPPAPQTPSSPAYAAFVPPVPPSPVPATGHQALRSHLRKHQYRGFQGNPLPHIPGGLVPNAAAYMRSLPNGAERHGQNQLRVLFIITPELIPSASIEGNDVYFSEHPIEKVDRDALTKTNEYAVVLASEEEDRAVYHDWVKTIIFTKF